MEFEEMHKILKDNPRLSDALEEAAGKGAGAEDVSELLVEAGVDAADAEALVAEYQRRLGASIAIQELDDNELDQVAGGGNGINCASSSDCDNLFQRSEYWNLERCEYWDNCDETFMNSDKVDIDNGSHHHHK